MDWPNPDDRAFRATQRRLDAFRRVLEHYWAGGFHPRTIGVLTAEHAFLDRGFGPGLPAARGLMDQRRGPTGSARDVFQTNFAFGRTVRLQAQNVHPGYWQSVHPDEEGYRPDQIMRYGEGNLNRLQIVGELHVKSGKVLETGNCGHGKHAGASIWRAARSGRRSRDRDPRGRHDRDGIGFSRSRRAIEVDPRSRTDHRRHAARAPRRRSHGRGGARRRAPPEARFYLSTEWGVPTDTIAVAIPLYLAHPELTALHAERAGYVEGHGAGDILRYLRHEMGHALNNAYRLYEDPEWVRLFGSFAQPYLEDYRPQPFSRRYVRHLPGWYAQMHPEEDWAETFAVWLTPGLDWRAEYADWPEALGKLEYCDRAVRALGDREPLVGADDLDADVSEIEASLERFYGDLSPGTAEFSPGVDGELRAIFDAPGAPAASPAPPGKAAAGLIRSHESDLMAAIYRWTGHFPEDSRVLLRHLAERAERLQLRYPGESEDRVVVRFTTLVTALAMNYVRYGTYFP